MQVMWKKNNNSKMHGISEIGPNVPAFLVKLWKLVEDPDCDLIYWSESGLSFIIVAQARFAREVLPLHYKHNNMASFIRQLNMYDFHKIVSIESGGLKNDKDDMEFAHQYFIRDHPYLLENIKRKLSNPKSGIVITDQNVTNNIKNGSQSDLLTKVLSDVNILKEKQESWDAKLAAMKRENEALWRELAIFRQKHLKQEQIINRLIHFIVTIVQPSRNVSIRRRFPLMLNDTQYVKKITKLNNSSGSQLSHGSPTGPTIHEIDTSDVVVNNGEENGENNSDIEYVSSDFLEPPSEYIQVVSPEPQVTINEAIVNSLSTNAEENPSNLLEVVLTEDSMNTNPLTPIDPAKVNPTVAAATLKHLENNKITTPITIKIPAIVSSDLAKKSTIPEKKIIYLTELKKPNKFQKKRAIRQSSVKTEPSKIKSSAISKKNNLRPDSQSVLFDVVCENGGPTILKPVTFPKKNNGYEKRKLPNTVSSSPRKFPNKKLMVQTKSKIEDITSEATSKNDFPNDDSFWKLESLYNGTLKVDGLNSELEKEQNSFPETDKKEDKFAADDEKTSNLNLCEINNSDVKLSNLSPKNDAENEELTVNFPSESMAVACQPLQTADKEELSRQLSSHVDNVQDEIDYLKEVLKGEGYNLDMNGLLGLFNDDPLSYGVLPPTDEELKEKENEKEVTGNEIMTYGTPNLMDLVELFGSTGTVQDWSGITSPISPTVSELTTPAPSPSTYAKSPKRRKI